jgi:SAM-dependent methyltransferase
MSPAQLIFMLLNLVFALIMFFLTIAFLTGAPFVPTVSKTSRKMLELSHIKKGMKVYDLGSGDGRLLILAANQGAQATGYEINPFLVLFTYVRKLFSQNRNSIHVYWKNFWTAHFSDADIVYIYLLPWRMDTLEAKLKKQLKPGAKVVSNSFIFKNWKPIESDPDTHVYVYKVTES